MSRSLSARRRLVAVLCGGFCGTITRYALSSLFQVWLGKGWPYDLLLINVTGALLLAFVTTLAEASFLVGPTRRLFLNVGFLGAYTTFSSFALGNVVLLRNSEWMSALLYVFLSMGGGVLAVLLGDFLGQWCISKVRPSTPGAKTTRALTGMLSGLPFGGTTRGDRLIGQDDLLLPERRDERKTRQRRS